MRRRKWLSKKAGRRLGGPGKVFRSGKLFKPEIGSDRPIETFDGNIRVGGSGLPIENTTITTLLSRSENRGGGGESARAARRIRPLPPNEGHSSNVTFDRSPNRMDRHGYGKRLNVCRSRMRKRCSREPPRGSRQCVRFVRGCRRRSSAESNPVRQSPRNTRFQRRCVLDFRIKFGVLLPAARLRRLLPAGPWRSRRLGIPELHAAP